MSENITCIKDPTVHIKPGRKLVEYLQKNQKSFEKESQLPKDLRVLIKDEKCLLKSSDVEWLNEYLCNQREENEGDLLKGKQLYDEIERIIENNYSDFDFEGFMEEKNKNERYVHELFEDSELVLPENEKIKRNPVLAERIERLKKEQEEREYKEMTKNVDTTKKRFPEDSLSYQMKMMNRHLIAVLQFVISVGAGFAFGFLGIDLAVGDLSFGVRLMLGIIIALVIAVAEFYFLAKHLNEEEKQANGQSEIPKQGKAKIVPAKTKAKLHKD